MSENFRDYLVALSEDPALRQRFEANRRETLKDARISTEERSALFSGDSEQIAKLLAGQDLPRKARDLIASIGGAAR